MRYLFTMFVFVLVIMPFAAAQGFSVQPEGINTGIIESGATVHGSFTITNNADYGLNFSIDKEIILSSDINEFALPLVINAADIFEVLAGEEREIQFSFILSETMDAGAYEGVLTINEENSTEKSEFNIRLTLLDSLSLEITPTALHFGDVYWNRSITQELTLKNDGTRTLSNIRLVSQVDDGINFNLNKTVITLLLPGKEEKISARFYVPFSIEEKGDQSYGVIEVWTADGEKRDVPIYATAKSLIELTKIRYVLDGEYEIVESDSDTLSTKVQPNDPIEMGVEAKNLFRDIADQDVDITDVEVEVTIDGIDEDESDIELTSESVRLDYSGNDKSHDFVFNFDIPSFADEGDYNIITTLLGSDKYGNDYEVIWKTKMTVERQSHELVIRDAKFGGGSKRCGGEATVEFSIINSGRSDEDYVRYLVSSPELDINIDKSRFQLVSDPNEDENRMDVSVDIPIGNYPSGSYPVDIQVFRSLSILEDFTTVSLDLGDCVNNIAPTPVQTTMPVQSQVQVEPEVNDDEAEVIGQTQDEIASTVQDEQDSAPIAQSWPVVVGKVTHPAVEFSKTPWFTFSLVFVNLIAAMFILLMLKL